MKCLTGWKERASGGRESSNNDGISFDNFIMSGGAKSCSLGAVEPLDSNFECRSPCRSQKIPKGRVSLLYNIYLDTYKKYKHLGVVVKSGQETFIDLNEPT